MLRVIEIEAIANVHSHLRQGLLIEPLVKLALQGGVDVLGPQPNTDPELTSAERVYIYVNDAVEPISLERRPHLIPFLMITETTTSRDIDECLRVGIKDGKVYPRYRTTKSARGVSRYGNILGLVQYCARVGMKIHVHPEHPWMLFEDDDAEFAFLPIAKMFLEETEIGQGVVVWEHGTDARCIPFWIEMAESGRFYVTLTAHHLATDKNETFGDVRSVCKPPIKTRRDRKDLVALVAKDYPWVMAGADDAPHDKDSKHTDRGRCACGAYTAPFLASLYAHALDDLLLTSQGVEVFVNFTSRNARVLHELPSASRTLQLAREPYVIPLSYEVGPWTVMPFGAGKELNWTILPE
jgi:dihydroorotase